MRDEGLFGFTYGLTGPVAAPRVAVSPLSILTPGVFRHFLSAAAFLSRAGTATARA